MDLGKARRWFGIRRRQRSDDKRMREYEEMAGKCPSIQQEQWPVYTGDFCCDFLLLNNVKELISYECSKL
jgi:hypothetical protein